MTGPSSRAAAAVLVVALVALGCGGSAATPVPGSATPTEAPPTAVPGGITAPPQVLPSGVTTTETEWGTILDAVPSTFPVFPGAEPAEQLDEPFSAAWLSDATADEVARWYEDALLDDGWGTVETGGPLEDGSRVTDAWADIPECRVQAVSRPAGESTIITVRYAAACAGGEG